ncbi:unnamed protein product [Somion occarium]|uniref:Uncharacterized protein n=1 Tax=Somion occarium TaxID=3059160 RepID=A0ABP1DST3_9APHY
MQNPRTPPHMFESVLTTDNPNNTSVWPAKVQSRRLLPNEHRPIRTHLASQASWCMHRLTSHTPNVWDSCRAWTLEGTFRAVGRLNTQGHYGVVLSSHPTDGHNVRTSPRDERDCTMAANRFARVDARPRAPRVPFMHSPFRSLSPLTQ